MNQSSPDSDDQNNIRRSLNKSYSDEKSEEHHALNQQDRDNRSSNQRIRSRLNQNEKHKSLIRSVDNDDDDDDDNNNVNYRRNERENQNENNRKSAGSKYQLIKQTGNERESRIEQNQFRNSIKSDNRQEDYQLYKVSKSTQPTSKIDNTIRSKNPNDSRSCVIDINISINIGGRVSHASVDTNNIRINSPSIRPTATIDNFNVIDIDLRSPERTARLATDGSMRLTNDSNRNSKINN